MIDDPELCTVESPRYQNYRENRVSQFSISEKIDVDKVDLSDVKTHRIFTEEPLPAEAAAIKIYIKPQRHKRSQQLGGNGLRIGSHTAVQDFNKLRQQILKSEQLFEDPEFPALDSSICYSTPCDRNIVWKRPKELIIGPQLFFDGFSRFDVQQGGLGDCWLLAAVANLTLHPHLFTKIVPEEQSFDKDYAGIFHFRFWQYGRWVDVVIDDRLPTVDGKLLFLCSAEPREFWSALLEKAYAKLHGSYEALEGGMTSEAMEDFTGGVAEVYELRKSPPDLFNILLKAYERNSLIGCSLEADPNVKEARTSQGLIRGHAYSITGVKYVDIPTPNHVGKISLLRLRNPWGNKEEWNGPWSDQSPEWRSIPDHEKAELGLIFDVDGEFWISFQDFKKYFTRLELCHLSPNALAANNLDAGKKKWEMTVFESEWVRGVTAGGCRNCLESFWHNPQYRITLEYADEGDDKCTIIVALMQKNRRAQKRIGVELLAIGFAIYRLDFPERLPKSLDINFFKHNASIAQSPPFTNLREVSHRFKLPPGTYCIVPSTFDCNEEAKFLLRIFSERKNKLEEYDDEIGFGKVDDRIRDKPEPQRNEEKISKCFRTLAGEDMEVDWVELKNILDYAMKDDLPSSVRPSDGYTPDTTHENCFIVDCLISLICWIVCRNKQCNQSAETHNKGFSLDVCRRMVAMMGIDDSSKLGYDEFKTLWENVKIWTAAYKLYDRDDSGHLSAFELREALTSAGYRLSNHVLNIFGHRYGTKDGFIMFNDYIMCIVVLETIIDSDLDLKTTELLI